MERPPISLRSIVITFVVVLVGYVASYRWITRLQTRKGPWVVAFTNEPVGGPFVVIASAALRTSNVVLRFPEEKGPPSNVARTIRFDKPNRALPFGRTIFDDLMFLPGTVTLDLFGHEVELLPRTLVLNRQPVPWLSDRTNSLWNSNKLPSSVLQPRKKAGYSEKEPKT